jgi:ATP-dependent DNA helicase RecG
MRESEDHVEFKSARHSFPFTGGQHTEPKDRRRCVLGYVVAMANERGGLLVLGMEDKLPHQVCGSDFAQGEEGNLVDAIYKKLHIRVDAYALYEDKLRVLVISVPSRPVGRLLKFEGVALMRTGESLREMSDTEMLTILSEQEPDYSVKTCEGLTMDDIDSEAMDKLLSKYADKQKNPSFANQPYEQCLTDLGLMVGDKLNYAALILVGKRDAIRRYLPQDEIIIEYRLQESSIPFTARKEIQGPLMMVIDEAWNYINQPASNPLQHINDGVYIFDIPAYNEDVIREGLLNACVHRSMQIQSSVVVRQSPYNIHIINAGGFPVGVDLSNILTTVSVPRAKRLCEVLEKTGMIERSGQGVDKIFYNCLAEGKDLPDYSESDAYHIDLRLSAKVIDPAFYLFIKDELRKREKEGGRKLSVFHLLTLSQIASGQYHGISSDILNSLLSDGLVIKDEDDLHLSEAYERAIKRARDDKRDNSGTTNDTLNDTIKVLLTYIDKLIDNKDIRLLNDLINRVNDTINDTLNDTINEKQFLIITKLWKQPGIKRSTLMEDLRIPLGSIGRLLNEISTPPYNLIEYRGPKKSGGYYLTDFGIKILTQVASKL